jgi:hypothetical protein
MPKDGISQLQLITFTLFIILHNSAEFTLFCPPLFCRRIGCGVPARARLHLGGCRARS